MAAASSSTSECIQAVGATSGPGSNAFGHQHHKQNHPQPDQQGGSAAPDLGGTSLAGAGQHLSSELTSALRSLMALQSQTQSQPLPSPPLDNAGASHQDHQQLQQQQQQQQQQQSLTGMQSLAEASSIMLKREEIAAARQASPASNDPSRTGTLAAPSANAVPSWGALSGTSSAWMAGALAPSLPAEPAPRPAQFPAFSAAAASAQLEAEALRRGFGLAAPIATPTATVGATTLKPVEGMHGAAAGAAAASNAGGSAVQYHQIPQLMSALQGGMEGQLASLLKGTLNPQQHLYTESTSTQPLEAKVPAKDELFTIDTRAAGSASAVRKGTSELEDPEDRIRSPKRPRKERRDSIDGLARDYNNAGDSAKRGRSQDRAMAPNERPRYEEGAHRGGYGANSYHPADRWRRGPTVPTGGNGPRTKYVCMHCTMRFQNNTFRWIHTMNSHENQRRMFLCPGEDCDYEGSTASELVAHVQKHTECHSVFLEPQSYFKEDWDKFYGPDLWNRITAAAAGHKGAAHATDTNDADKAVSDAESDGSSGAGEKGEGRRRRRRRRTHENAATAAEGESAADAPASERPRARTRTGSRSPVRRNIRPGGSSYRPDHADTPAPPRPVRSVRPAPRGGDRYEPSGDRYEPQADRDRGEYGGGRPRRDYSPPPPRRGYSPPPAHPAQQQMQLSMHHQALPLQPAPLARWPPPPPQQQPLQEIPAPAAAGYPQIGAWGGAGVSVAMAPAAPPLAQQLPPTVNVGGTNVNTADLAPLLALLAQQQQQQQQMQYGIANPGMGNGIHYGSAGLPGMPLGAAPLGAGLMVGGAPGDPAAPSLLTTTAGSWGRGDRSWRAGVGSHTMERGGGPMHHPRSRSRSPPPMRRGGDSFRPGRDSNDDPSHWSPPGRARGAPRGRGDRFDPGRRARGRGGRRGGR